ncbi:polyribonucleotide nucleotidyltransferase [Candidatus Microgenomates bacterium]|nr:polyribonucleotide nucleotidyltransferase [Candidatus Microgenomates bacterium]
MTREKITHEFEVAGRKLIFSTGDIAGFASGAVMARYGDLIVLATVVVKPLLNDPGYMPMTVDYVERLYAGGRIKGSQWVKREGRPSDEAILSGRLIDRSLRPLFPKDYRDEVQVVLTTLSVDAENDPAVLSAVAASAALALAGTPWKGPVGVVRVGAINGDFIINPLESELKFSDLDLVVTGHDESILMLEAGSREISEEKIIGAITAAQREIKVIQTGINEFVQKVGAKQLPTSSAKIKESAEIDKKYGDQIEEWAIGRATNRTSEQEAAAIKAAIKEDFHITDQQASFVFEEIVRKRLRDKLLKGIRPDGRKPEEIRQITVQTGILPRTHGSAIFTRGQTQALSVATLGAPSLEQKIESAEGEETKRYMHYYSMPPYATGETGRIGSPNRREIGHGALAERALMPVLPSEEKFPYAIHVVSEILSSNGSTSMASTCGSTLALMDAGVPISRPVAGIAMGLVIDKDNFVVLSDIAGIEDGSGDMDFKVAGTSEGITAIQLDVKTLELTVAILEQALEKAKVGRMHILAKITEHLAAPREKLSEYAPRIVMLHIPTELIGEVIGPGGRMIRKIMADSGAQIEVEDDGTVNISGVSDESVLKARSVIEGLTKKVQPGEVYEGEVKRIQPFGAFVEILPGKDGLVHISDLSDSFVNDPNEVVSIGQKVTVKVKEIDELGRINLTMRNGEGAKTDDRRDRGGPVRSDRNDSRGPRNFGRRPGGMSRAPHFPISRFMPERRGVRPFRSRRDER